jgi:hypothetical protein
VKWDFLFMAESLDGNRNVGDNPEDPSYRRHGVGYRSARHFDILNENIVFFWRDLFFNYPANGGTRTPATPSNADIFNAYADRRQAFDNVVLLNNLVSHDEVFPHNDPYRLFYAYAQVAALDGVPMLFYGQEAGAQNDDTAYAESEGSFGLIDPARNFAKYELNFGKSIPNFKVYNHMSSIWDGANRDWGLQDLYGRVNQARLVSPALRSPNQYFLSTTDGGYHNEIYAVAKVQEPGRSAGEQDVVLVFVTMDYASNPNPAGLFSLDAPLGDGNYFGIEADKTYNVRDLPADAQDLVWTEDRTGADLLANGLYIGLPYQERHMHYLQLVETNGSGYSDQDADGIYDAVDADMDGDGLPNVWENLIGGSSTGVNPNSVAPNGMTYLDSFLAGLSPLQTDDVLDVWFSRQQNQLELQWRSKPQFRYMVERTSSLVSPDWQPVWMWTADETQEAVAVPEAEDVNIFYRVRLIE